ncbi:hypothetical protein GF339_14210, partial [candidate division KSB3 bacterium]|nr:hypothetical protein [candidate division KSB3 bacterium]MBD3325736.1 hypothetical protein [candidate division KSB3 bacterium]
MHKFSQFDPHLNIRRLPLLYSLGDLSSIREIFTPEHGDIGRTQLPFLPPLSETILQDEQELEGYLVETSSPLLVALREFLREIARQVEHKHSGAYQKRPDHMRQYVDVRRECINRVGTRLVEVLKQERRLGLYNLFWLVISKHVVLLLDKVIAEQGEKQAKYKIAMQPIIAKTFQEVIRQVRRYFHKYDSQQRRSCKYIHQTITSHLGTSFNYEFSRAVITDQIHMLFPQISRQNFLEYAQTIFVETNDRYHITYHDFMQIYSGIRAYVEKQVQTRDPVFFDMVATVLKIPLQTVEQLPLEIIMFHPSILSLFAQEIKQLPVRKASRKKMLFKTPQLGSLLGEDSWEFALNDYLTFAKDLRRSEIITFFRNRIAFVSKTQQTSSSVRNIGRKQRSAPGIVDRISYQFDKGRIINDLRQVTLVFLDLRGFTEVSARVDDQELKEYLYTFFDPAVNILNHFGGVIKTYAGDGILASFGAKNDHAVNAIRAAIEIQQFFHVLKQQEKIAFTGMGIGIHTGLVEETYFFPDLEAPSHNTVIGLTANIAGRLSSGKAERHGSL